MLCVYVKPPYSSVGGGEVRCSTNMSMTRSVALILQTQTISKTRKLWGQRRVCGRVAVGWSINTWVTIHLEWPRLNAICRRDNSSEIYDKNVTSIANRCECSYTVSLAYRYAICCIDLPTNTSNIRRDVVQVNVI